MPNSTRIAYLLLCHEHAKGPAEIISRLRHSTSKFFIHVDAKSTHFRSYLELFGSADDVVLLNERVRVYWGGWSIVEATLRLMRAAHDDTFHADRLVLLSGACAPILPIPALQNLLSADRDYISAAAVPNSAAHKNLDRFNTWHLEGADRQKGLKALLLKVANKVARRLPVRPFKKAIGGRTPYAGSQWWALRRGTIESIIRLSEKDFHLIHHFQRSWIPDESFVQTLVFNIPDIRTSPSLTFADWSNPKVRPANITTLHLRSIASANFQTSTEYGCGPIAFVRKFNWHDKGLISELDQIRRQYSPSSSQA